MISSDTNDLETEFRLTLERAGLRVSEQDRPQLFEQFKQAKAHSKALDKWEDRVKDVEPGAIFLPPARAEEIEP